MQGVYERDASGVPIGNAVLSPIDDTMTDLIWGLLGVLGYVGWGAVSYRERK